MQTTLPLKEKQIEPEPSWKGAGNARITLQNAEEARRVRPKIM